MPATKENILKMQSFDCNNWDELCCSIVDSYSPEWNISIIEILSNIRSIKKFETKSGSYNVPMWHVNPNQELECYKIFRKPMGQPEDTLVYEFHPGQVFTNYWMKAEISGSPHLTGLTSPDQAKFHMLMGESQVHAYLNSRKNCVLFSDHTPYICKVKARNFTTVDLIYVPPTTFVWGIDAKEIYVTL